MAIAALLCTVVASMAMLSPPAGAESSAGLPIYDGATTFPAITEAGGPEQFSWQVELQPGQILKSISPTEAEVDFASGPRSYLIVAEKASDAHGTAVPTTLEVSEGDVITLVVHHREGTYLYPVTYGEGFTVGEVTVTVIMGPPDETEIREREEARRRAEEAQRAAASAPKPGPGAICTVPALHDLSLAAAKARLRAAHCGVGQVHLATGATAGKGKVVKQFRDPGAELPEGTPVAVKLGAR